MSRSIGEVFVKVRADVEGFVGDVTSAGRRAETSLEPFSKKLGELGGKFDKVGKDLSKKVTAPIVGFAGLSVKAFADFDDKMTQSLAIQGPDVAQKFRGEMEQTARSVAKDLGLGAADAAESFYFLASAGLDAETQIAALPQVAAFSKAGMFDMARATDLATDAQSALGLTTDDAAKNLENMTRVTDVMVGAATLANTSVEQLGDALTNKAGAALRVVNKDVEEGAAVLAALADQGIKGAEAGEKLNVFLRDTARAANANAEEFEALGLQIFDSDGKMRNMADIIENMEEVFGDMSDAQMVATLDNLGLNRSVADVSKQLLGTSDDIRQYEAELRGMGGITQDVAERQMESFSGQLSIAKAELTDLALDIGPIVIDQFLRPLIANVRSLVERFSNMDDSTKLLIVRIAGIAAAIGPVLMITGKLMKLTSAIIGPFARLSGILFRIGKVVIPPLIKGIILLTKAMLANPVVLIVVAIAALIAGLVLAYKRFEGFRNLVDGVFAAIRGFVEAFVGFFVSIWDQIFEVASAVWEGISEIAEVVIGAITGALEIFWGFVETVWSAIQTAAEVAWEIIGTIIGVVVSAITTYIEVYKTIILAVWTAIRAAAEVAWNIIRRAIEIVVGIITRVIEVYRTIVVGIWNTIRSAGETAFGIIRSAFERMTNGIRNLINGAKTIIEGVWTAIRSAAETAFGIVSSAWDTVTSGIRTAIEGARDFVTGAFDKIKDTADRVFGGIGRAISGAFSTAVSGAKNVINPFIRTINRAIDGLNKVPWVNIPKIPELANGGIIGGPTVAMIGEAGAEAVIPLSRPRRAMQLMEQSGLADMVRGGVGGGRMGAAVNIENATFVAPLDAEKVAQKVVIAEKARAFAA